MKTVKTKDKNLTILDKYSGKYPFKFSPELPPLVEWIGRVNAIGFKAFLPGSGTPSVLFFMDDHLIPVIEVTSEMNDYEKRGEAGRLCFKVLRVEKLDTCNLEYVMNIYDVESVKKLTFYHKDFLSESGIVFSCAQGNNIIIVAAAYPYYLAVLGIDENKYKSVPEFDMESYRVDLLLT